MGLPSPKFFFNSLPVGTVLQTTASTSFTATINDLASVSNTTWTVLFVDDLSYDALSGNPGSYTIGVSGPKNSVATLTSMGPGTCGFLAATVNQGFNPLTNALDPALTYALKWWVPAANGAQVCFFNEQIAAEPIGWLRLFNTALRGAVGYAQSYPPVADTVALRGPTADLLAARFAPDVPANVASTGLLAGPTGNQTLVAIKGASHTSVPLVSVSGGGSTLSLGDGTEITAIDAKSMALVNVASIAAPAASASKRTANGDYDFNGLSVSTTDATVTPVPGFTFPLPVNKLALLEIRATAIDPTAAFGFKQHSDVTVGNVASVLTTIDASMLGTTINTASAGGLGLVLTGGNVTLTVQGTVATNLTWNISAHVMVV